MRVVYHLAYRSASVSASRPRHKNPRPAAIPVPQSDSNRHGADFKSAITCTRTFVVVLFSFLTTSFARSCTPKFVDIPHQCDSLVTRRVS
jgi:hypothetical protein